jgi:hypothetical protein
MTSIKKLKAFCSLSDNPNPRNHCSTGDVLFLLFFVAVDEIFCLLSNFCCYLLLKTKSFYLKHYPFEQVLGLHAKYIKKFILTGLVFIQG